MPQAVIVLPDRALRLLWEHAFAVAGWRTHAADTTIDALAVAFNVGADAVVTAAFDTCGANVGADLIRELAADAELSSIPRYLLTPANAFGPDVPAPGATVFDLPCDPYWLIVHADNRLGRTTPAGLGRRPLSDGDLDLAIHFWWWDLAATDLILQIERFKRENPDPNALLEEIGNRLARRIDARISFHPRATGPPDGEDFSRWSPDAGPQQPWVVPFGDSASRVGWWQIMPSEDGLTALHAGCVRAVAAALGLCVRLAA